MYVITGATGHIGSEIARELLKFGKQVRAIARDKSRLKTLEDQGAEIKSGSLDDADFLTKTMEGATAVFTMIPPALNSDDWLAYQDKLGETIATALERAKVPYVVHLSSLGADLPSGTGPIVGSHRQEQRLNRLDAKVLHLRPTFFMENLLSNIPLIREMGILGSSLRSDIQIPFVATRDIAAVAADHLNRLDFKRKTVQVLLGQRDLSMPEVAKIIGGAIGKPDLPYVQFSYEDAENGMIRAGLSPDVAKKLTDIDRAFNTGLIKPETRTPENTTPTSLEEFAADVFITAYKS